MGRPKEWLDLEGAPLLTLLTGVITSCCSPVVVVARSGQVLPALAAGVVKIDDPPFEREAPGPFPALTSGLSWLAERGATIAYLSSCDAACLRAVHIAFLVERLAQRSRASAIEAVLPVSRDGHVHPLASVVSVDAALPAARALNDHGERRLRALFDVMKTEQISEDELPDAGVLRTFNTPEEWEQRLASAHDAKHR
jgi:molybdopterin-guanine dinucleotide biosynthesis protein A